jgi:hypothetical protein
MISSAFFIWQQAIDNWPVVTEDGQLFGDVPLIALRKVSPMAYVSHYQYDVFISYAHLDDQALVPGQDGWITHFHYALNTRVQQIIGSEVVFWRDARLQGNDDFSDALLERLNACGTMLSVHSPRYLQSEWCRREVDKFLGTGIERPELGTRKRLFKVLKSQIELSEQHPDLQRLLGYQFYEVDQASGRFREFSQAGGEQADLRYWNLLEDLAQDLAQVLDALRSCPDAIDTPCPKPTDNGPVLYVAQTSADVQAVAEDLRREYQQRGWTIRPAVNLPYEADALNEVLSEQLHDCDIAVHLLGKRYGVVPEGSQRSVIDLQITEAANAASSGKLHQFIWQARNTTSNDARLQTLEQEIEGYCRQRPGPELLRSDLDELKAAIDRVIQPHHPETPETVASWQNLYLVFDPADEDPGHELEDALFDAGFEVLTPLSEGSDDEIEADHQENIQTADAILLYYGAASEAWFKRLLRRLDKWVEELRGETLPALVLMGPPAHRSKERFRSHRFSAIDAMTGVDAEHLITTLQQAQTGATA